MIKETVKYIDFEGNEVTEELHFHLTQTESIAIALELPDGVTDAVGDGKNIDMTKAASKITARLGGVGVFNFIKDLVLKSYGIRTPDDRGFKKNAEIRENFECSLAFDAFFTSLMQDDEKAAKFVNGVFPSNLAEKVAEAKAGKLEAK